MPVMPRPNILFLFTDQHALAAVGCYGETPCRTPHLDRLAAEGVRFQTAYTTCPVCTPARATIMTGLYPHAHGMCCNVEDLGCSVHEIVDRPQLLSRRLQAAGYRCGYTGKWHLGTDREIMYGAPNVPALPRDVGFEGQQFAGHGNGGFHYTEYQQYLAAHGWRHKLKPKDDGKPYHAWNYGVLEGPTESTVPYFLAEHTIGLIDRFRAQGEPWFIWHNFWGPHNPYWVPEEWIDLYRGVEIPEWPSYRYEAARVNRPFQVKRHTHADALTWADWAEAIRYYYAFTTLIDAQIGRILAHLDETGQRENTVIVFAADHGETLGTHGGLTDKGWHHFEEIQRIPFIVWLPPRLRGEFEAAPQPGAVLQEWASLADVYPTFLDLAGAEWDPEAAHGRSLLPLLRGQAVEWPEETVVEFFGVNSLVSTMVSIRRGRYKYGWNAPSQDDLYDLEADPYELRNLADDPAHAATLREMRAALGEWFVKTGFQGLGYYRRSRLGEFPY
ncbi:MAG: sulfatase-like hydrolase/transferase [Chloroflexi bacterium]|nr:sulfatase-like hydrolase/transferase [Chloroflexota bacterium]